VHDWSFHPSIGIDACGHCSAIRSKHNSAGPCRGPAVKPTQDISPEDKFMHLNFTDFLKLFGIAQSPEVLAIIADVQVDFSAPAGLLDAATARTQIKALADGIGVFAVTFPDVHGLQVIHDDLYKVFGFQAKVQGFLRDEAIAALSAEVNSDTTFDQASQMAAGYVSARTGIPVSLFGPFLLMLVKLIAKILLAAI